MGKNDPSMSKPAGTVPSRIDVFIHSVADVAVPPWGVEVLRQLGIIVGKVTLMAGEVERIEAGVGELTTVEESVEQLVGNLAVEIKSLRDQIAAGGLSPEVAARLTVVADALEARKAKMAALVVANTPSA